jgi:hypothetical protein
LLAVTRVGYNNETPLTHTRCSTRGETQSLSRVAPCMLQGARLGDSGRSNAHLSSNLNKSRTLSKPMLAPPPAHGCPARLRTVYSCGILSTSMAILDVYCCTVSTSASTSAIAVWQTCWAGNTSFAGYIWTAGESFLNNTEPHRKQSSLSPAALLELCLFGLG